ncbi:MAG: hypothetical protein ACE5GN_04260, partial [Waddliaceae bacterium]
KLTLRSQFDRKSRSRKLAMWLDSETRDSPLSWWQSYARPKPLFASYRRRRGQKPLFDPEEKVACSDWSFSWPIGGIT